MLHMGAYYRLANGTVSLATPAVDLRSPNPIESARATTTRHLFSRGRAPQRTNATQRNATQRKPPRPCSGSEGGRDPAGPDTGPARPARRMHDQIRRRRRKRAGPGTDRVERSSSAAGLNAPRVFRLLESPGPKPDYHSQNRLQSLLGPGASSAARPRTRRGRNSAAE
jgi:hypothetical protein